MNARLHSTCSLHVDGVYPVRSNVASCCQRAALELSLHLQPVLHIMTIRATSRKVKTTSSACNSRHREVARNDLP
jgi:hypothetical protein